jgi:hypothetical protein
MRIVPVVCHNVIVRSEEISRNARECLQLAERATEPDVKKSLIELSIWMEAALERHIFDERSPKAVAK